MSGRSVPAAAPGRGRREPDHGPGRPAV